MTTYNPTPSPTWAAPAPLWAAPTAPLNPLFRVNPWATPVEGAEPWPAMQPGQVMNTLGIPTTIPPEATPESLDEEIQVGLAKLETVNPEQAALLRSQYGAVPKEDGGGFFGAVMDVVGAIGGGIAKGVMGALELIGRTGYIVPQWFDPEDKDPWYTDIGQALSGQDKTNWNEVFQHRGWDDEGFMGVVRATVGLGADIITDPLTWATLGAGAMTAPATRAATGARLVATRYGGFVDEALRLGWGTKEDVADVMLGTYQKFAGQALQKGAAITDDMTEEAAQMLASQAGRAVMAEDMALVRQMFEAGSEVYLSVYNRNFGRFLAKGGDLVLSDGRVVAGKDIKELLESAARAGNGNKELWQAAREASGALGGVRFGYAIPFTSMRYLSPMLPMSNVFSPLARMGRFAAGLSVTRRAEALLKAGEATWEDLALLQRSGYSALKDGDQHAKVLYQKLTDDAGRFGTAFWQASELAGKATGWFSPGAKMYRMGLGYYFAESKEKELRGVIANLRNHVLYDTVDEGTAQRRQLLMRRLEDVWHISERVRKDTATPEDRLTFAKWLDWFGGTDAPVETADIASGRLDKWFWENVGNPLLNKSADAEGQVDEALRAQLTSKLGKYRETATVVQGDKLNVARELSAVQGRGREVLNKYGVMVRDTTYVNLRDAKVINRATVERFQSGTALEHKRSFWISRVHAAGIDDRAVGRTTSGFAGVEAFASPQRADDVEVVFNPRKVLVLGEARGQAVTRGTDEPIAQEVLDQVQKVVDDLKARSENVNWTAEEWLEFEQGLATEALHARGGVDFDAILWRGKTAEQDRLIALGNKQVMPWEMARVVSETAMDVRQSSGFLHRVFHPELKRWLHGEVPIDDAVIVHRVRDLRAKALRKTAGLDLEDSEQMVRETLAREMEDAGSAPEHIAQLWAKDEAGNYVMPIWETDPLRVHNDYVNVVSEGVAGSLWGEFTENMDALGRVSPAFMGRVIKVDRAVAQADENLIKSVARLLGTDEKSPLIKAMRKYVRRRDILKEREATYRQTHLERVRAAYDLWGSGVDLDEAIRRVGDGDPELERFLDSWDRFNDAYDYDKERIMKGLAKLGEEDYILNQVEDLLGTRSWSEVQWEFFRLKGISRDDFPTLDEAYNELKKRAKAETAPGPRQGGLAYEAADQGTWDMMTTKLNKAREEGRAQLLEERPDGDRIWVVDGYGDADAAGMNPHFMVERGDRVVASRKAAHLMARDAQTGKYYPIDIEEARAMRNRGQGALVDQSKMGHYRQGYAHEGGDVTAYTHPGEQTSGLGTALLHAHWKWQGVATPGDLQLMWAHGSWSYAGALLQISAGRKYLRDVLHIPDTDELMDLFRSGELGYREADGTVITRAGAPRKHGQGGARRLMTRDEIEAAEVMAKARLRALEQAKARRLQRAEREMKEAAEEVTGKTDPLTEDAYLKRTREVVNEFIEEPTAAQAKRLNPGEAVELSEDFTRPLQDRLVEQVRTRIAAATADDGVHVWRGTNSQVTGLGNDGTTKWGKATFVSVDPDEAARYAGLGREQTRATGSVQEYAIDPKAVSVVEDPTDEAYRSIAGDLADTPTWQMTPAQLDELTERLWGWGVDVFHGSEQGTIGTAVFDDTVLRPIRQVEGTTPGEVAENVRTRWSEAGEVPSGPPPSKEAPWAPTENLHEAYWMVQQRLGILDEQWERKLGEMGDQPGVFSRTRTVRRTDGSDATNPYAEVTLDVTSSTALGGGPQGRRIYRAYRTKRTVFADRIQESKEMLGFLVQDVHGNVWAWVDPGWRRKGIGRELFSIAEDFSSQYPVGQNPLGAMRKWLDDGTGASLAPWAPRELTSTPTIEGKAWVNALVPKVRPKQTAYADEVSAAIESLAKTEPTGVEDLFLPARVKRAEKGVRRELGKLRKEVGRAMESHAKRSSDEAVKVERAKVAMNNADAEVRRVMSDVQDANMREAIRFEPGSPPGGRTDWVAVNIPGLDNVWMHPFVAEELNHVLGLHGNRVSGFRKYWREWLLGPWKKWATYRSPGFHVRNLMGGVWNNMLGGVNMPDYHFAHRVNVARDGGKWANRLVKDSGDWERLHLGQVPGMRGLRETLTYRQLGEMLSDQGIGRSNATSVALVGDFEDALKLGAKGKATNLARSVDQRMRRFSTTVEDFLRVAAWSGGMRSTTGDLYGSRAFVMLRHGDYEDLTDAEAFIKDLVPFYKWMRTNLPYQAKALLEKPGVMATTLKLERYMAEVQGLDPNEMEKGTPEWMQRAFSIPIPGSGALQGDNPVDYIGLDLPYGDLYKGGREYLSSFLPVVSDLLESTIVKQDLFMGKPLGEKFVPAGGLWSLPGFKQLLQALPGTIERDGVVYIPDTFDNVLSGVPVYGRFRNWLSGDPNRVAARWGTLASFFGGVGYREADLTADEMSFLYDTMIPTLARYRSMGVVFPSKDQLIQAGYLMQESQPFDATTAWPDGVVATVPPQGTVPTAA